MKACCFRRCPSRRDGTARPFWKGLRGRQGCLLLRGDRKSTRLNSSHLVISYAVFCLKKKIIAAEKMQANRARIARQRTGQRRDGCQMPGLQRPLAKEFLFFFYRPGGSFLPPPPHTAPLPV